MFYDFFLCLLTVSFPHGSDNKESAYNVEDLGLIPGLGRSHGEGNSYSLQYSCLENSMDGGAWQVQSMESDLKESDTTKKLSLFLE